MKWQLVSFLIFGILTSLGCEEILDEVAGAAEGNNPPPQEAIPHGNLTVSVTAGVPMGRVLLPGSNNNHVLNVVMETTPVETIVVNSITFRLDGDILPENVQNVAVFDPAWNRWLMGIAAVIDENGNFVVHMNQAVTILRGEELILEVEVDIGENADEERFKICPTEVNWRGEASAHNGTSFAAEGTCGQEFDVYASAYLHVDISPWQPNEEPLGYGSIVCFRATAYNGDLALSLVAGEIRQDGEQAFDGGLDLVHPQSGDQLEHRAVGQNGQVGLFQFMTDDREFVLIEGIPEEFCVEGTLNRNGALLAEVTDVEAVDLITGEDVPTRIGRPLRRQFIAGQLD